MISISMSLNAQITYVDNGTSNAYNLQNGDSLYIKQGTYTGAITSWSNSTKITVAQGATFKPSGVAGYRSAYKIYGSAILPAIGTGNDFAIYNYGTTTINGNMDLNSNNLIIYNHTSSTFTIKGNFAVNSNNHTITNNGQMTVEGNLAISSNNTSISNVGRLDVGGNVTLYATATIANKTTIVIDGNFNSSKGTLTNEGLFQSKKKITFGGNTTVTNTCRLIAQEGVIIDNKNATIYNSGLIWASGAAANAVFTNSGTFINSGNGVLKTVEYTNYGSMYGNGYLYILGKSTLGSQASVGSNGSSSNMLRIYTVNRTKTTQIFDDQWGTVYANAVYATFAAPDTVSSASFPCSAEYAPLIILPVTYANFTVTLAGETPVLNWSASFDDGTNFEVERSENGSDFSTITTVAGKTNINDYQYRDLTLSSNHASVVYYRVKAIELNGMIKFSDVKSVRFATGNNTALQTWPNPFNNQFTISYKASQKNNLTISIFNVDGKLQVVKTASVNSGNNSIIIAEASRLAKGIYVVRVSNNNGEVSSSKIVKQ